MNMQKKKKIVSIIFVTLMALTVLGFIAAIVIDYLSPGTGDPDMDKFAVIGYGMLFVLMVLVLIFEGNLFFDVIYAVSERGKKKPYKTFFHILAVAFLFACAQAMLLHGRIRFPEEIIYALMLSLVLTRLVHLSVCAFKGDIGAEDKTENNIIPKENIQ